MNATFTGTGVALVTPFKKDLSLDIPALQRLVRHVIDGGSDYIVALGTTAESATLDREEKASILRIIAAENAGQLPLMAGIGGNNTIGVAREMADANLDGYDAILSVSPYYNRPTQEGIFQHFNYLAERAPRPLVVYNVPARTGSNVLPGTMLRLAAGHSNIIGIKEACGDMGQIRELLAGAPDGFHVISGDDFTAAPTALAGGAGVISVLGQALPSTFSDMMRLAIDGEAEASQALAKGLLPLMDLIFREGNPAGIKALLHRDGLCEPYVRLPLVTASPELQRDLDTFMSTYLHQRV